MDTRYIAIHSPTGITVEVVELIGPSGGWPEIKYTGDPDLIDGLVDLIYPDDGTYPEPRGTVQAPFVYDDARPATPGWVLEQVVNWLDDLGR